ncbi:MAG: hypothetical protein ACK5C5_08905 [Bacteroidota bacterium]|jgi:hypothetical protein
MKNVCLLCIIFLFLSCGDNIKEEAQETLNKGGELVGETATEVLEGIREGMDQSLECELILSDPLIQDGVAAGKFEVASDSIGGTNNVLTVYLIFNKDFSDTIHAKAFSKKNLEIGRSLVVVTAKAGDAAYYDFNFDKRTYIEVKSRIELGKQ